MTPRSREVLYEIVEAYIATGEPVASRSVARRRGDALSAATSSGRPTVLEVMVNQQLGEPFRRDALHKPTRLLAKYAAYSVK